MSKIKLNARDGVEVEVLRRAEAGGPPHAEIKRIVEDMRKHETAGIRARRYVSSSGENVIFFISAKQHIKSPKAKAELGHRRFRHVKRYLSAAIDGSSPLALTTCSTARAISE
jgi:hypothetical protein